MQCSSWCCCIHRDAGVGGLRCWVVEEAVDSIDGGEQDGRLLDRGGGGGGGGGEGSENRKDRGERGKWQLGRVAEGRSGVDRVDSGQRGPQLEG